MKKLLILTFILSPMVSFAGDNRVQQGSEEIYARLPVAETQLQDTLSGRTMFMKKALGYVCLRTETLEAGETEKIQCFYYTDADLAK